MEWTLTGWSSPCLLPRAYLRGEQVVELGNGEIGLLPREWLERHARLLDLGESGRKQDGNLRFHSAHAGSSFWTACWRSVRINPGILWNCAENSNPFRCDSPASPAGLTGGVTALSARGSGLVRFLAEFGFGGVLADDMGLGKTIQALAWLLLLKSVALPDRALWWDRRRLCSTGGTKRPALLRPARADLHGPGAGRS